MCDPLNEKNIIIDHPTFAKALMHSLPHLAEGEFQLMHLHCGEGELTCQIADAYPDANIIGVDWKEVALKKAYQKKSINTHLHFRLKEPQYLDLSETYSFILLVIEESEYKELPKIIQNVKRLLKKEGVFFLYIHSMQKSRVYSTAFDLTQSKKWEGFFKDYEKVPSISEMEWISSLQDQSLFVSNPVELRLPLFFETKQICRDYLYAYAEEHIFSFLPKIKQDEFVDDLLSSIELKLGKSSFFWKEPVYLFQFCK